MNNNNKLGKLDTLQKSCFEVYIQREDKMRGKKRILAIFKHKMT